MLHPPGQITHSRDAQRLGLLELALREKAVLPTRDDQRDPERRAHPGIRANEAAEILRGIDRSGVEEKALGQSILRAHGSSRDSSIGRRKTSSTPEYTTGTRSGGNRRYCMT